MAKPRRSVFALALLGAACLPALIVAGQLSTDRGAARDAGYFRQLSAEQRMMGFLDMRRQIAGMTDNQKQAYRQARREKFASMTEAEKLQLALRLQSEWDALSSAQKASFEKQISYLQARHLERNATKPGGE